MKKIELPNMDNTAFIDLESMIKDDSRYPYLVIFNGNDNGRRHKLSRGILTIGRSSQAGITIEDELISRTHCILEWLGDTITIEDKGSTNGIFVNARKVNRALLLPGDSLQLGNSIMKIEYKSEAEIRSEDSLQYRASFDSLTGIFNRQHFIRLATMEMGYAIRHKLPMGVIMMDIDGYKRVNDTYGHQLGDYVLTQFANIIIENKRTEDLLARYGGDEFINLPRGEVNNDIMYSQCERIRKAVENYAFRSGDACFYLTISLGYHIKTATDSDVESVLSDLISKADQALYRAKEKGKNRTESLI